MSADKQPITREEILAKVERILDYHLKEAQRLSNQTRGHAIEMAEYNLLDALVWAIKSNDLDMLRESRE